MIRIAIIFITAILISVVAAYFSIVGLAALFAATFWGVVIMGATLEAGKVVAATWAHEHWGDPSVSRLHKGYLVGAVSALMLVTSLGIYGYLSKGHLEQAAPMAGTNLQIQQGELRIQQIQADNERLTTRLNQLDQSVNVMLSNDRASQGLRARRQQAAERAEINTTMDANNKQIQELQTNLLPLKTANLEVEAKLGPVKYVAELFGWKDPEAAVRMIILIIMVAFDPLALVLIISGGISLRQYQERKRLEAEANRDAAVQGIMVGLEDAVEMQEAKPVDEEGVIDTGPLLTIEEHEPEIEVEDENTWPNEEELIKALHEDRDQPAYPFMQELEAQQDIEENQAALQTEVAEEESIPVELDSEQEVSVLSEKEQLLNMLEKNPDILQDIIEVVDTYRKPIDHSLQLRGSDDN